MLQSNTNASSFKLQPAPRPKSKRRPENAPPVSAFKPSDAGLERSCFEDDEDSEEEEAALTPKASLFKVPLVSPKPASPTVAPTRRHCSSTLSTSARPTSSVHRLLNAMSIPLSPSTRPLSTASSPSATVSIMLTSKSPTPSSPLFPRRTLMRSLSSTCINPSSRSPTSPPSDLRKRMGWRGSTSAARADELSILLSPGSPLTPRRAEQLHTPTQASIDSLLHLSHHPEQEMEPLSATLKALGAKRKTHRFEETSPPATAFDVTCPDTSIATTVGEFEVMTAERKIFNLPTWVRFEANHHARNTVVEENRLAADGFSTLKVAEVGRDVKRMPSVKEKEGLLTGPKTSQLGDVAPSSPNGSLLGGFDFDTTTPRIDAPKQQEEIVSVVRRLPTAAIRGMDSQSRRVDGKVKSSFASVFRSALHPPHRRIRPSSVDERRDGWGGILTRTSWFPSHSKGPLVSPSSRKGLRKMLLQSTQKDEEWEDVLSPKLSRMEERSFLEMHAEPRWKVYRARPVHPDPPNIQLNTWHTRPLLRKDTIATSQLITKGTQSVENRPISSKRIGRTRKLVLVIVAVCLVALVINVVVVKETGSKPVSGEGRKKVFDPLVGNMDGSKLAPATATTTPAVDPSVAKAAHMSQP